jgi:hypothetical protein
VRNAVPGAQVLFDKKQQKPRSIPSEMPWNWLGVAAAIVFAAIITFGLLPRLELDADFNYWAVSDVNANDLQMFKQQFEKQTLHH